MLLTFRYEPDRGCLPSDGYLRRYPGIRHKFDVRVIEKLEATGSAHKFVNGRYKLRGSLPLGQRGSVGFQFLSRDRVAHNPASGELVGKKRLRPFICLLRQRGHPRAAAAAREGVIGVVLVDRDQRIVLQRSADLGLGLG